MGQCASHRRVASANSPSLETTSPSTSRRADHLNVASTISCASRQKTADATFQTKIPPSAADRRKFVSSLPLLEVPPVQTSKVGSTYQKHDVSSHWCPPSDLRFSLQKSKPTLALSHQHLERPPHELLNSEQTRRYPRCDSQPPHPAHQRNEAPNAELKMPTDNTDAHHAIARTCLHPDKHLLRDTSSTLFRDASISLTSVCTCDRSEKVPISTGDYPEAATCYRTPLFKSQLLAARPASAATSHLTQDANLSYHTSRSHRNEMVARLALEGGLHRTFSEASSEASSSYDPMTKMRNERTREVTERDQQVSGVKISIGRGKRFATFHVHIFVHATLRTLTSLVSPRWLF